MLSKLHGREARPAPPAVNVMKTLVQSAVIWTIGICVAPTILAGLERRFGLDAWQFASPASRVLGIALFAIAAPFSLCVGIIMAVKGEGTPLPTDTARKLVLFGPYRWIRNPMAVSGLALVMSAGLYLGSPSTLLFTCAAGLLWNYAVRPWEEQDLSERFGAPYDRYRASVRCWLPRLHPYVPDE